MDPVPVDPAGVAAAVDPTQTLLEEILAEENEVYGHTGPRLRLSIPFRPRLVAVFAPIHDRGSLTALAAAAEDQLDFYAGYIALACVGIEAIGQDGVNVAIVDQSTGTPVTMNETLAERLHAPAAVIAGGASALVMWLCRDSPVAVSKFHDRLDEWEAGALRGVEAKVVGESQAGPKSTQSPGPAPSTPAG